MKTSYTGSSANSGVTSAGSPHRVMQIICKKIHASQCYSIIKLNILTPYQYVYNIVHCTLYSIIVNMKISDPSGLAGKGLGQAGGY